MLRNLRSVATLLLPVLAAAFIWVGSSCNRDGGSDTPPVNTAANDNRPADNAATGNAGTDVPQVEGGEGLSEADKRKIWEQINRERQWWDAIRNPSDPTQRFEYMTKMLESMRFFLQYGAWQLLQAPMKAQVQARRKQVVFLALFAALTSMTPPPTGTSQSRADAVQTLKQALTIDPAFAHGHYLLGYVMLMDQQAVMGSGQQPDRNTIQTAAQHIQNAISLRDEFPDAWGQLAMAYTLQGTPREAVECAVRAIDEDPADVRNWARLLAVLQHFDRLRDAEELIHQLIEKHNPEAKVRLGVYGQLAELLANSGQFQKAYNYMLLALDAAREVPEELQDAQWIDIYCAMARLAVMKPQSEPAVAAAYLHEAAAHARKHKISLMRIITAWTQIVARIADPQPYLPEILDMCFEVLGAEALGDVDRARLTQIIAAFLSKANLANLERRRLWQLLGWTLDQVQIGNDQLLELAIQLSQALLPIRDDSEGRPRIAPELLEDADENTVRTLVQVLCNTALESTEYRITLPGCDVLGHLLTATRGVHDAAFISKATEILGRPVTRDQTQRKSNVGEVLVRHPVEDLSRQVVAAMQATADSDVADEECKRLFPMLHRALNGAHEPDFEPGWSPTRSTDVNEYKRIAAGWADRLNGEQ